MKWKPRVIIASVIVLASMVLTSLGFNTFIQSLGWLAAGYLFGKAELTRREKEGGK